MSAHPVGAGISGGPAIRTWMEISASLVGVGMTCRSVLMGAVNAGASIDLFTSCVDGPNPPGLSIYSALPDLLKVLPYRITRHISSPRLQRRFLDAIGEGEIAYLWPSTRLSIYEALAARNILIVAETVNTRMAVAKPILDAAYDALGLPPGHGITDARIANQNARHALCTAAFAPSPMVEESFLGTVLEHGVIPTSYGTWVPEELQPRGAKPDGEPVVFLFVGKLCVRKGAHLLLEAWRRAPRNAILRIVGEIEPAIRTRFADVLDASNVSCAGFIHNVAKEFGRADVAVLPSLEEGDPIVTYEAAAHGVPVVASRAGAGRIGAETGAITIVDPQNIEMLRDRFAEFAADEELRRHWGALARNAAPAYDWNRVGPLTVQRLHSFLAARHRD